MTIKHVLSILLLFQTDVSKQPQAILEPFGEYRFSNWKIAFHFIVWYNLNYYNENNAILLDYYNEWCYTYLNKDWTDFTGDLNEFINEESIQNLKIHVHEIDISANSDIKSMNMWDILDEYGPIPDLVDENGNICIE